MNKSDFNMMCECCCSEDIIIYSSVRTSFIGYYCTVCECLHMFDEYNKLDTYDEDLERLRKENRRDM